QPWQEIGPLQVNHLCLVRIGGATTLEHLYNTSVLHGHTGSRQGTRLHTVNDIGIEQHHTHRHLIDTDIACQVSGSAARLWRQALSALPPSHGCSGLIVLGDKPQRDTVVAPALPGGWWAIVEHVPVVAAAAHAMIFCAWPDQFKIPLGGEHVRYRREKTWPARTAIKFHCRRKQRQAAASADEHSRPLLVVQWAGEGTLGAFSAQYVILRGREDL